MWDYTMIDVEDTETLGRLGDASWEAVGIGNGKILLKRQSSKTDAFGYPGPQYIERATA
jgi:hypothetical protein